MRKRIFSWLLGSMLLIETLGVIPVFADDAYDILDYEASVLANDSQADEGNIPSNTIDGNLNTKWAAEGKNKWICYTLAEPTALKEIGFAFTNGNGRVYSFDIQVSMDRENWTTVLKDGKSCGTTNEIEMFPLEPVVGKYVRLVGFGNSVNAWNNVAEVDGIHLEKNPYKITIDNLRFDIPHKILVYHDSYLIPAESILKKMSFDVAYDENIRIMTAKKGDCDLKLDFSTKQVFLNNRLLDSDAAILDDDGVPRMRYEILRSLDVEEVNYREESKTIEVITSDYKRIQAAYEAIDREFLGVLDWIAELYDPETGGFYNAVSGAKSTEYYPSGEATCFALSTLDSLGISYNSIPDDLREKFVGFLQSIQDPETGYFVEPWPQSLSYTERDKVRIKEACAARIVQLGGSIPYPLPEERTTLDEKEKVTIVYDASLKSLKESDPDESREETEEVTQENVSVDEAIEMSEDPAEEDNGYEMEITQGASSADLSTFDYDTRVVIPDSTPSFFSSINSFLKQIESLNWVNATWNAGDRCQQYANYIYTLPQNVQTAYMDAFEKWLTEHQNPRTGYWATNDSIDFDAVSGAFKVIATYQSHFDVPPPNAMLCANTVIETLRLGDTPQAACYVRNPLSALQMLSTYDAEVKEMLADKELEIVELYAGYIHDMFHPDGGASSSLNQSQSMFGGMSVGRRLCEGDIDGTRQMTIARDTLATLFGRKLDNKLLADAADEFWQKLREKAPIVKDDLMAKPGVVLDETFESYKTIDDAMANNCSFNEKGYLGAEQKKDGTTNQYLLVNDDNLTFYNSGRVTFDRVQGAGSISFDIMVDRNEPYSASGNDLTNSFIQLVSHGDRSSITFMLGDIGTNDINLNMRRSVPGGITLCTVGKMQRGEWNRITIEFDRNSRGMLTSKVYLNGAFCVGSENAIQDNRVPYLDSLLFGTVSSKSSRVAIDNVLVIAK